MPSPSAQQATQQLGLFPALLARDIEESPYALRSFTPEFLQHVRALTAGVEIDLDAALAPDD